MAIGDRLKELRLRSGKSLQQVADAIGASKAHIWELEANRSKNPSLDLLQKLASYYGVTVAYLIEEPEDNLSKADQFFRRNSNKLAALTDEDFAIFEQLLNRIVDHERK
jgi:transcriptional regulator with XRE-family HTH domain